MEYFRPPKPSIVTASEVAGVAQAGEYSWLPPSPPHIHVPPVLENGIVKLPSSFPTLDDVDLANGDSLDILQRLTACESTVRAKSWLYEARREFQSILPFLFLGPFITSKNSDALEKAGITMLLVVRDARSAQSGLLSGKKAAEKLGIEHAAIDVDGNTQLIHDGFPNAIRIINDHLLRKYQELANSATHGQAPVNDAPITTGKVLVFCESGNYRSAAVVAAYMMAMYRINVVVALQYIQAQRFCIALDDPLRNLLFNYQQLLEARRAVLGVRSSNSLTTTPQPMISTKRRIDDVEQDDHDMDSRMGDPDDVARFASRKPFAPFHEK